MERRGTPPPTQQEPRCECGEFYFTHGVSYTKKRNVWMSSRKHNIHKRYIIKPTENQALFEKKVIIVLDAVAEWKEH